MSEETSDSPSSSSSSLLLLPRREPFDHGLLPIPKLVFTDGTLTLTSIKNSLLSKSKPKSNLVDAQTLAESLQISADAANLVIETLISVLPSDRQNEEDEKNVNVHDLMLFLYVQSYKRLGPRPSKDAAAVADVWPSMSAFDGYLSALSPLQLVRCNSRRLMPSQADEEAHQLSYLEKHMANIFTLLSDSVDGENDDSLVLNCHDSVIYILAPLRFATVYGCSESTIVLGAIGKAVRVEHCERVQIITAAKRICIANCRECVFFLGVNQQPLIIGDNPKLQVAPYNTFYPQLEEHMAQVGINATVNRWNGPYVLGAVDPHDSISHAAGDADVQPEPAMCLDPDQFTIFPIPKLTGADEPTQPTKDNPFPLPESYMASLKKTKSVLNDIQQVIRNAQLEENRKQELACALHVHFRDWLYASGNIRQLYCLQGA